MWSGSRLSSYPRSSSNAWFWLRLDVLLALTLTGFLGGCSGGGHNGGGGGGGAQVVSPLALPAASSLPAGCLSGTVGAAYTCDITASGGTPAGGANKVVYAWTVTGLPSGMTDSASTDTQTVTISGTPPSQVLVGGRAITLTITVKVADATGANVSLTYSLTINPGAAALTISTQSPLPYAYVGVSYSELIQAQGGKTPYSFSLASGSTAPPGFSFTGGQAGTVAGTPSMAGNYQFTVKVTDSSSPVQSVSQVFTVTVNAQATVNCSGAGNLSFTICGYYWFELYGFNSNGGPTALAGTFVANNTGNIVGGEVISNDSAEGVTSNVITGGSYTMDSGGDGRGVLTLSSSKGTIGTFRFVAGNQTLSPIEQFDSSGTRAEGQLLGPETAPVTGIPGSTDLAIPMTGANGAGKKTALLGLFAVGKNGCDGSSGSLISLESFITNSGGTVNTGLTATGSCTAPDSYGVGTAQISISGGSSFSNATLNFSYVNAVIGSTFQGTLFLETDTVSANQPLMVAYATANAFFGLSFGGLGPCLFGEQGTTDGTVNKGVTIASITRFTPSGTTATGTLAGIIDQNAAGTATSKGTWPYSAYSVDGNGVGTFTGTGQKPVHVVLGSNGTFWTLDESTEVRTGSFSEQGTTSIVLNGVPFVIGNFLNSPQTRGPGNLLGVVTPSGMTAGEFTGTVDLANDSGQYAATAVTGSYGTPNYISLAATTGRGTGVITLTNGNTSSSKQVVIYALRRVEFMVLDQQSSDSGVQHANSQ